MRRLRTASLALGLVAASVGWHAHLAGSHDTPPARFPRAAERQRPQQPTFRVQVDLVQVDVIATDASGRFVGDLTRDDFEILEDGQPQRVEAFQLVDVPIRSGGDSASVVLAPSDVRSNSGTGRVYLIVLDDVSTPFERSGYARRVATRFVQQYLEPGDTAAVAYTSGRRNVSQEFTTDRRLLLASIDNFMGRVESGVVAEPEGSKQQGIRAVVSTLAALAQSMAGSPGGRKACVYVGPGFPMTQSSGAQPISPGEYRDLAAAANRANVTFYTIDPAGLATLAEGAGVDSMPAPDVDTHDAQQAAHEGLAWLAVATGGFASATTNNFDRPFERIRRETSSYYLLGYYPPEHKQGSSHTIGVRVRRPGVRVRARSGYAVPKGSERPSTTLKAKNVPPTLLPALDSPLPSTGVRFSAAAVVFNGAPNKPRWASVILEIDGRDLDASGRGGVDVGIIAVDKVGAVKGQDVRHVDLALGAQGLARLRQAGLRVHSRVPFEGDAKAVRIAVADAATPRVGALSIDLDPARFNEDGVSMSGLLVTDDGALRIPTTNADEEFRQILGGPASTRREFRAGDAIGWTAEIYQRAPQARDVRVTTIIEGSDKRVVFRREESHPPSEMRTRRDGIAVTGHARLADLPAGGYVLRIEALVAGAKSRIAREVPFRVVGN